MPVVITRCERPWLFEDVQVRGAFRRFTHTHRFAQAGATTTMVDEFDYAAPFGILGRIADALFLERYMRAFLTRRALFLKAAAEAY